MRLVHEGVGTVVEDQEAALAIKADEAVVVVLLVRSGMQEAALSCRHRNKWRSEL